jgi:hypothetical protein
VGLKSFLIDTPSNESERMGLYTSTSFCYLGFCVVGTIAASPRPKR